MPREVGGQFGLCSDRGQSHETEGPGRGAHMAPWLSGLLRARSATVAIGCCRELKCATVRPRRR